MADKKTLINIIHRPWTYSDIEFWTNPKDTCQNAIIEFNGKKTRLRTGVLIVKDDTVLLCEDSDAPGSFDLPGGGLEENETVIDAGKREAQEEVCINLKKVRDTEYDYCECHTEVLPWVKKSIIASKQWYNYYTCLLIGEYDSDYLGKIDKVDLDPQVKGTSRWYKISEVINKPTFKKQWKKALINYGYYVSPTLIKEDLTSEAKKYFGIVPLSQSKVGFYINNDGSILDGSGELFGNNHGRIFGQRHLDHRDIAEIMYDISGSEAMLTYMKEGNIRLIPESPGISVMKRPTKEQIRTLSKIISAWNPEEFYVDIFNESGDTVKSKVYDSSNLFKITQDLLNYFDNSLTEDTRNQLLAKSRGAGPYKDQSRGKNRFERRKYSKVTNAVKAFNQINMNDLFKKDLLTVQIPVIGETDTYTVSIKMDGVVAEIARGIKNNNNKLDFKVIIQALTKIFNTTNIYVNCTCKDYLYNYEHWNIVNNISTSDSAHDPGPGKGIKNPDNSKGIGCKHVLLVLNNGDWLMKVASVIKNYIFYAETNMKTAFDKLIFPKLYGIQQAEAIDQNLVSEDINLETEKNIIEKINEWAQKRGQYQKGSNVNPVYANKLAKDQSQKEA